MTTGEIITISGILVSIVGAGLGVWMSMLIKVAQMAVEIENLKSRHGEFGTIVSKIFDEIKEINERMGEKEDRK